MLGFPVSTIAVFALWLSRQGVDYGEAVSRLRATNVTPQAMRDAWGTLTNYKPEDESCDRARRLLLEARRRAATLRLIVGRSRTPRLLR
ncbi:MAG: hypothetical protein M3121_03950, partial [Chloroflexota bacterium]|nr:hypothetical protein [Chloroflexota bacterium]